MIRFRKTRLLFTVLILLAPLVSHAQDLNLAPAAPLAIRTQNPLYLQFLAMPLERPHTLNRGQFSTSVSTSFSNIFEYQPGSGENVEFDMEQWRTAFQFDFGIAKNLDARVEIPLISQFGGFLDGFVEGYHQIFGLPNAGRSNKSHGAFAFKLAKNGTTLFDYSRQSLGFADTSVRVKYRLLDESQKAPVSLAGALFLKLPTGETSNGLGSGRLDFGAAVFLEKNLGQWRLNSEIGAAALGGHTDIDDYTRWGFLQFGQSVSFAPFKKLAFTAQLFGNTSAIKNFATNLLADPALEFTLGANGLLPFGAKTGQTWFYNVGFSEDILSRGPSVDFSLFAQLGVKY